MNIRIALCTAAMWALSLPVHAALGTVQDREFKDPQSRYAITLKEGWEPVMYKDGAGTVVADIIFENRERGLLRIREQRREGGLTAEEFAQREQDLSIRFRPGFTEGTLEPFSHPQYEGVVLNFDFTYGGRPKTARYYYLKTDGTTFSTLLFEGSPQVLRTMRNRTDLMARSFRLLP